MDRRLKERLTGATILVLIAVLFIPELLSGPAKRAAAHVAPPPVDMSTNSAAAVRTYTVDLNHPPTEASAASVVRPAPASVTDVPLAPAVLEETAPHPKIVVEAPLPTVAQADPVVKDTFAPIGSKGGWAVQLGSFGNRSNADKLVRSLRSKGIRVYVSSQSGKHRVRAGPFPDRATSERMGARLKSQGQSVTIIAP